MCNIFLKQHLGGKQKFFVDETTQYQSSSPSRNQDLKKEEYQRFEDLVLFRIDRTCNKGGGIAFAIREDVPFKVPDSIPDKRKEHQAIQIGNLVRVNIDAPPKIRCANSYAFNIIQFLPEVDSIITGYFNAHNGLWYTSIADARGETLRRYRRPRFLRHELRMPDNASQNQRFNIPGCNPSEAAAPCLSWNGAARKKWDRVIYSSS